MSQWTSSLSIFWINMSKCWFFALICGWIIVTILSITSRRESWPIFNVSFPFSIFDISRTSLISPSKCLLESDIFFKQSFTRLGSSMFAMAIVVIPTIPFIGVRISWLILDRKSLFALFARIASCLALSSSYICCWDRWR